MDKNQTKSSITAEVQGEWEKIDNAVIEINISSKESSDCQSMSQQTVNQKQTSDINLDSYTSLADAVDFTRLTIVDETPNESQDKTMSELFEDRDLWPAFSDPEEFRKFVHSLRHEQK